MGKAKRAVKRNVKAAASGAKKVAGKVERAMSARKPVVKRKATAAKSAAKRGVAKVKTAARKTGAAVNKSAKKVAKRPMKRTANRRAAKTRAT